MGKLKAIPYLSIGVQIGQVPDELIPKSILPLQPYFSIFFLYTLIQSNQNRNYICLVKKIVLADEWG